jgi:hypothetical protein
MLIDPPHEGPHEKPPSDNALKWDSAITAASAFGMISSNANKKAKNIPKRTNIVESKNIFDIAPRNILDFIPLLLALAISVIKRPLYFIVDNADSNSGIA